MISDSGSAAQRQQRLDIDILKFGLGLARTFPLLIEHGNRDN
jgi:hypothetical protein